MDILYEYQEKLAAKEQLMKEMEQSLPLTELRRLKVAFDKKKHVFLEHQKSLEGIKKDVKQKKEQAKVLADKITANESLLYGGTITNGRELSSLEEKGKFLQQEEERLTSEAAAFEEKLGQENHRLSEIAYDLKKLQHQFQKLKKDIGAKKSLYENQIAAMAQELQDMKQNIPQKDLDWFYAEKDGFQGKPLALIIHGDTCNICRRLNPPSLVEQALAHPKTVRCDCCGRLLCS